MIKKELRDKITTQALSEIEFARDAKIETINRWHKSEDTYYSKKLKKTVGRANVNLNEAQGFVQSFLAKIHHPYNFKYIKGDESDLKAAQRVNAIRDKDSKNGRWDFKIMLARIQLIIYGRYIFEYHASSSDKYKSTLSNVDVYQFLIDPSAGGVDIEKAFYLGRGGIIRSKKDIKNGIKSGKYLKTEGNELIKGESNITNETEEDVDANNRWINLVEKERVIDKSDQWKFWEWYTTYEGVRYYLLLTEDGGKAIRVEKLVDMFKENTYPFFSAAAYPHLTEFWSPSPLEGVTEIMMAKAKSINQMLDNGESINRPMKAFNVGAIKNAALLKYRTDGSIPVKDGVDIDKAIKFYPTIPLQSSMVVYDKLDAISDVNSGVNSGVKGQASEQQVGIYEGNQANAIDRFSLVSDSEADAQNRFARLYLAGLDEHLTTKVAIEMIGINGVQFEEITKKHIKRNKPFNIMVITSGKAEQMQTTEKRNKLTFLSAKSNDQTGTYNIKILAEMEANIAGFSPDEIKYMLDTKTEGEVELMSEAAQDIEDMLAGKEIEPNDLANTAYLQKIKDYMRENKEYMIKHPETADLIFNYIVRLQPIVIYNMSSEMNKQLQQQGYPSAGGQAAGMNFSPNENPNGQAASQTDGSSANQGTSNAQIQSVLQNYGK